ncbi:MAG: hypothetical protein MRJ92_09005 [Nitrospira sp.]|nr:hypothetical protein [Nitrospira sp.]
MDKPSSLRQAVSTVGIKYQIPRTHTFFTAALFDLTRENFIQTGPSTFLQVQRDKPVREVWSWKEWRVSTPG